MIEEVNAALKEASGGRLKGLMDVTDAPLVSSDIVGTTASAIVDLSLTQVVGGNLVKVIAWYDNEWGYCNRLIDEVVAIGDMKPAEPKPTEPALPPVPVPPAPTPPRPVHVMVSTPAHSSGHGDEDD